MNEELYLVAYKDIEQKEIDEALWLKAMSHASGDKTRAKWAYIELRVDQMLRDPSLRHSVSRKVRKPTHQSGAFMMWFSLLFCVAVIGAAVVVDFANIALVLTNGFYFLDAPSLILVLPVAILFGISATSWRTYGRCWTYTLGGAKLVSISEANSVARCLKVMGDVSLIMGLIGTFIGTVFTFQNLTQDSNLGQELTVASLTLAYGIVLKLVSYVAEQRVRNLYLN
ncbi:MAG TPA: hypothetical protein EYM80_11890 [Deltaproteobacteria bacterium]|nr:MotA/TolQ/ExbB proton channel family protein [SAR324 cluster bacterium]HHZ79287.1 hypothetical protein [Candidatus Lambdaproteobacteria bacterium]HIA56960.1 hypothetical protein [Candidatus Lambdaproteobacteria bacterium]HIN48891.1 hypothetical protein [Deltaproteobacteria bacterium]